MPFVELRALNQLRRGGASQEVFFWRNRTFQEHIPSASIEGSSAVIGFDTSSWVMAERADRLGKPFFLDQSTTHALTNEAVMAKALSDFPAWREHVDPRRQVVLDKEEREYSLAARIVVASSYVKRTLMDYGVNHTNIVVNPYGVDSALFHPARERESRRPFRFLFIGTMSVRKGVPVLIESWRKLTPTHAELWLVGDVSSSLRHLIPALPGLHIISRRPHTELPQLMRQCDALVLPSYCEGFGLVLLEALASGLPVITTEATGGPDCIRDGVEGRLVPSGDVNALADALTFFLDHQRDLTSMSIAARARAEEFSWDAYGDRWRRIVDGNA